MLQYLYEIAEKNDVSIETQNLKWFNMGEFFPNVIRKLTIDQASWSLIISYNYWGNKFSRASLTNNFVTNFSYDDYDNHLIEFELRSNHNFPLFNIEKKGFCKTFFGKKTLFPYHVKSKDKDFALYLENSHCLQNFYKRSEKVPPDEQFKPYFYTSKSTNYTSIRTVHQTFNGPPEWVTELIYTTLLELIKQIDNYPKR